MTEIPSISGHHAERSGRRIAGGLVDGDQESRAADPAAGDDDQDFRDGALRAALLWHHGCDPGDRGLPNLCEFQRLKHLGIIDLRQCASTQ
jgi:hypothetical protein